MENEPTLREQARELAKRMIQPYVKRGDSIESVAQGQMGIGGPGYNAQIGGWFWPKLLPQKIKLQSRQIGVGKVNTIPCNEIFLLQELYDEIQNEEKYGKQLTLW